MSAHLHIMLVEKPYLEEFKGLCRKYKSFISLQYFEREKIKGKAYFTPVEIRLDDKGKRLSNIINISPKLDDDWDYYDYLLPRVIRFKTFYRYVSDVAYDLSASPFFTDEVIQKHYQRMSETLSMMYEHSNCAVVLYV